MNYTGSYKNLLKNSEAALLASIEIYNKPLFEYRDECFVILLLNSWELFLKAVISKNKKSIFYKKKKNQSYRTLSLADAFNSAEKFFPKDIPPLPIKRNLDNLTTYRDNAVHFYNESDFKTIIYSLAQTSIKNFKDLSEKIFDRNFSKGITWSLLPLSFANPIDPIEYIKNKNPKSKKKQNSATSQFIGELIRAMNELEKSQHSTERLLTIFKIKFESTKKFSTADVTAAVSPYQKGEAIPGPITVYKNTDPNDSHPLKRKNILEKIKSLDGKTLTTHVFDSIVWHNKIKVNKLYCWESDDKQLTKYSNDFLVFLKRLKKKEIETAVGAYKKRKK